MLTLLQAMYFTPSCPCYFFGYRHFVFSVSYFDYFVCSLATLFSCIGFFPLCSRMLLTFALYCSALMCPSCMLDLTQFNPNKYYHICSLLFTVLLIAYAVDFCGDPSEFWPWPKFFNLLHLGTTFPNTLLLNVLQIHYMQRELRGKIKIQKDVDIVQYTRIDGRISINSDDLYQSVNVVLTL